MVAHLDVHLVARFVDGAVRDDGGFGVHSELGGGGDSRNEHKLAGGCFQQAILGAVARVGNGCNPRL